MSIKQYNSEEEKKKDQAKIIADRQAEAKAAGETGLAQAIPNSGYAQTMDIITNRGEANQNAPVLPNQALILQQQEQVKQDVLKKSVNPSIPQEQPQGQVQPQQSSNFAQTGLTAGLQTLLPPQVSQPLAQVGVQTQGGMIAGTALGIGAIAGLGIGGAILGAGEVGMAAARTAATSLTKKSFIKTALTIGGLGGAIKLKAGTANSILTSSMSEMEDALKEYQTGLITEGALNQIMGEAQSNIDAAEQTANTMSKIDVFGFLGLKDTLVNFERARRTTLDGIYKRTALAKAGVQV